MNIFTLITLLLLLLLIVFLFSSSGSQAYAPDQKEIPDNINLDEYLKVSESAYSDIVPGTEKTIIWHDEQGQKTDLAVIYLHGFSASRQEVSPLVENLGNQLSANVFLTRLVGHGRSENAMQEVSVDAMLADAEEAFNIGQRIGKKVLIISTSTGGTLATWLATKEKTSELAAVVLLSPNYGVADEKARWLLTPGARYWLPWLLGKTYQFKPDNDKQKKYWSWRYPTVALIPMMQLVAYVNQLPLQTITVPVLVLYSKTDKVVDVDKILQNYARFGSDQKQIIAIEGTQGSQHHVLAGDALSPATTDVVEQTILAFLKTNHVSN